VIKYGQRGSVMQEQMYFPEGGVGSFLTSNMDEMPDNVLAFGQPRGINSMGDVANRMAQMGRNGDTELAHLRRDEVVMTEDMARDPRIRNAMAEVFSDNDMDMARYTVGNAANSVNPYTGNREFFLKKIISGVKKIVKAAAPIVIPLAMNALFPGMGAIASGFIGSGISSLAQGNSFKDSMKAGVMGGLVGGIGQGFRNMSANKGFFSGEGQFGREGFKFFDRSSNPVETFLGKEPINANSMSERLTEVDGNSAVLNTSGRDAETFFRNKGDPAIVGREAVSRADAASQLALDGITPDSVGAPTYLQEFNKLVDGQAATAATKGSLKILPTVGATLGIGALAGGFKQIPAAELEDPYDQESPSQKLLAANPEKYTTGAAGAPSYRSLYDVMVPTVRQPIYQQFVEPVQTAARGGEMENFPRKTGYIAGPGTETSDSIPAMLSDGEFVMNAKAVRGAGGGSRERGVRKMYDMMRAFEGGAVA